MPFVQIRTNREVGNESDLLSKLSALAAKEIGKPESYVMASLAPKMRLSFGGSQEPAAFIECKSIGLKSSQTKGISAALCEFCEQELGVSKDRVYIEFASAEGSMWGWKGGTF
ncbi:MAG: phenylpyruvate tautomerase MIF-related protein [Spirochaetaceae bacterium]